LQLEFPLPEAAECLILKASKLRNTWDKLLKLKLEGITNFCCYIISKTTCNTCKQKYVYVLEKSNRRAEHKLSEEMIRFMNVEIGYTVKRLLAADQKIMYAGPSGDKVSFTGPNPFSDEWQVCEDDKYGGLRMSPYLTYDW
jgi:hypothetical protein